MRGAQHASSLVYSLFAVNVEHRCSRKGQMSSLLVNALPFEGSRPYFVVVQKNPSLYRSRGAFHLYFCQFCTAAAEPCNHNHGATVSVYGSKAAAYGQPCSKPWPFRQSCWVYAWLVQGCRRSNHNLFTSTTATLKHSPSDLIPGIRSIQRS